MSFDPTRMRKCTLPFKPEHCPLKVANATKKRI